MTMHVSSARSLLLAAVHVLGIAAILACGTVPPDPPPSEENFNFFPSCPTSPHVAADGDGNFHAVWMTFEDKTSSVWHKIYRRDLETWSEPVLIDQSPIRRKEESDPLSIVRLEDLVMAGNDTEVTGVLVVRLEDNLSSLPSDHVEFLGVYDYVDGGWDGASDGGPFAGGRLILGEHLVERVHVVEQELNATLDVRVAVDLASSGLAAVVWDQRPDEQLAAERRVRFRWFDPATRKFYWHQPQVFAEYGQYVRGGFDVAVSAPDRAVVAVADEEISVHEFKISSTFVAPHDSTVLGDRGLVHFVNVAALFDDLGTPHVYFEGARGPERARWPWATADFAALPDEDRRLDGVRDAVAGGGAQAWSRGIANYWSGPDESMVAVEPSPCFAHGARVGMDAAGNAWWLCVSRQRLVSRLRSGDTNVWILDDGSVRKNRGTYFPECWDLAVAHDGMAAVVLQHEQCVSGSPYALSEWLFSGPDAPAVVGGGASRSPR